MAALEKAIKDAVELLAGLPTKHPTENRGKRALAELGGCDGRQKFA